MAEVQSLLNSKKTGLFLRLERLGGGGGGGHHHGVMDEKNGTCIPIGHDAPSLV